MHAFVAVAQLWESGGSGRVAAAAAAHRKTARRRRRQRRPPSSPQSTVTVSECRFRTLPMFQAALTRPRVCWPSLSTRPRTHLRSSRCRCPASWTRSSTMRRKVHAQLNRSTLILISCRKNQNVLEGIRCRGRRRGRSCPHGSRGRRRRSYASFQIHEAAGT